MRGKTFFLIHFLAFSHPHLLSSSKNPNSHKINSQLIILVFCRFCQQR